MNFSFTEKEEAFRQEVCQFMDRELTEDVVQEIASGQGWGPNTRQFLRNLGAKGWLAPSWPKEYGGIGSSYMERFIIAEEVTRRGGPWGLTGASMAGPTIMLYGSEEQKKEWLPPIASGEIEFALGYSEPQAGSDLAALDIRAVDHGDYYIMNGQKVFNTAAHYSEYHWLGVRTDPKASPRHRGISLFIVDLKSPGITVRPLQTMGSIRTNEVFYDDVRVPKKNRVGEENRGWYYIATALDFERMIELAPTERLFEEIVQFTKETKRNGQFISKDPVIRQKLAQFAIEIEVSRMLAYRVAWMVENRIVPNFEAAMLKVFWSELHMRLANAGTQILGLYGQLQEGSKWAPLKGRIEIQYRDAVRNLVTRGSSEIMRNIIAFRGLGLPR